MENERPNIYDPIREVYQAWQNHSMDTKQFLDVLATVYPPDEYNDVLRHVGISEETAMAIHNPDMIGPDHIGQPLPPFGGGGKNT